MLTLSWKVTKKAGLVNTHSSQGSKWLDIDDKYEHRDISHIFHLISLQPVRVYPFISHFLGTKRHTEGGPLVTMTGFQTLSYHPQCEPPCLYTAYVFSCSLCLMTSEARRERLLPQMRILMWGDTYSVHFSHLWHENTVNICLGASKIFNR